MKPFPISVQLYSVRDAAAKDFPGVLKKISDMGYGAVEFAGLYDRTPKEVRKMLDDLGMGASSAHGPMPDEKNVSQVIDAARTLGYARHVSGFGPDQFKDKAETLKAAAVAQKSAELLKGSGITLGIHNHWWEFDKQFDGKYPHEVFMAAAPDVFAEVDTYWVAVGGADTAKIVKQYGSRAPLLHIKDGPGKQGMPMTAVGAGTLDWKTIIGAAAPGTEYLIVELDSCATDMMEAVAASYKYLTGNGFALGRK